MSVNRKKHHEICLIFHEIIQGKKFHEILHHYTERTKQAYVLKVKGKDIHLFSALQQAPNSKAHRYESHTFYLQTTLYLPYTFINVHQTVPQLSVVRHLSVVALI